jgi:hypothetical protein
MLLLIVSCGYALLLYYDTNYYDKVVKLYAVSEQKLFQIFTVFVKMFKFICTIIFPLSCRCFARSDWYFLQYVS